MHNDQLKCFFVGGPNQRKDFHLEEGEELFYMRKGDMSLPILTEGRIRTVHIREGEVGQEAVSDWTAPLCFAGVPLARPDPALAAARETNGQFCHAGFYSFKCISRSTDWRAYRSDWLLNGSDCGARRTGCAILWETPRRFFSSAGSTARWPHQY